MRGLCRRTAKIVPPLIVICLARISALLALAAAVAAPVGLSTTSAADARVSVYFTRGEQFAPVERPVPAGDRVAAALEQLFAGPTESETARGLKTNIPKGDLLRGAETSGVVVTVDVSRRFAVGTRASLQARLAQVVFTATAVSGVERVRIAVGGVVRARLAGMELQGGIGRDVFAPAPAGGPPAPPPPRPFSPLVQSIQERLTTLRYLPRASSDGLLGEQTRHAILAFQGWEGLARDGRATRGLLARLERATPPRPRAGAGRRIEVSIARQVALLVSGARVMRAIHVSTGARGFETPRGAFRVFRKELRSWSYPYRVWLPYASYFVGGVAFHESLDVPPHPASHGCVRIPSVDAPVVYSFAGIGTRVVVW